MSKTLFAAAKELIEEKKYFEARAILKTIDHPTAREWERRLDILDPVMLAKDNTTNWTNWKGVGTLLGLVIFTLLSIKVILIYFPALTTEGRIQLTVDAQNQNGKATRQAFNATETAKPTITRTPTATATPTNNPTEWAYITQTVDTYVNNQTATVELRRETEVAAEATYNTTFTAIALTSESYWKTRAAMPTRTTSPTPAVTPMSPTDYYALDAHYMYWCPRIYCRYEKISKRGQHVVVVGIVEGDLGEHSSNKWYEIEDPFNMSFHFYDHVEWYSPHPPAENEHSVIVIEMTSMRIPTDKP